MKKIIFILLFALSFITLLHAYDFESFQRDTKLYGDEYKKYVEDEKYPGIFVPFAGGKIDIYCYVYQDQETYNVSILERGYEWCRNIILEYENDPDGTINRLKKEGKLSYEEALIVIRWANMIDSIGAQKATTLVPKNTAKERMLIAMYAIAKSDLDKKFNKYRNPEIRKKAFYALQLYSNMVEFEREMSEQEEVQGE